MTAPYFIHNFFHILIMFPEKPLFAHPLPTRPKPWITIPIAVILIYCSITRSPPNTWGPYRLHRIWTFRIKLTREGSIISEFRD